MGEPVRSRLTFLLLGAVVLAAAIGSMWNDSATADEGAHIASGLIALREARLDFFTAQPPLAQTMVALPVAASGYRVPEVWRRYGNRPWVAGHLLLESAGDDVQRLLRLARMPVIAMLLALCIAVAMFVRASGGTNAAALSAFALTGFCPTLLAHGRLATVDMALTLFAFVAVALLLRLLRAPSFALAAATGGSLACVLASKVSGTFLVPFFAIVIVFWWIRERRLPFRELAVAGAASLIVFAALHMLAGRTLDPAFAFREYLVDIGLVRKLYGAGYTRPQFLLGEFSRQGWPHYNLVALAVKTTLASLLLIAGGIVVTLRRRRFEPVVCFAFAALFLLVASFSSLNLGVRHVLPIYPFLYAGTALALIDVRPRFRGAIAGLLVAHCFVSLAASPSYLSYFNVLIGSHRNADRVLIDSNLDWGQDLRRLASWCDEHGVERIRVHYFGAASVARELGGRGESWPAPRPEPLPKGWFAVSRHFYRLSFSRDFSPVDYDAYLAASRARYITSIGGSIDVYRVD